MTATKEQLMEVAREIYADQLENDIEFSVVYEDEEAMELTEAEQRFVHKILCGATVTAVSMPMPEGDIE